MSISTSVLEELLQRLPHLRPQLYFKSSLTALSHAMEDQVLAGGAQPLVIASFQRERYYRQEAHRYERIAALTPQVYVLAAPETSFTNASRDYESIAFESSDQLSQEWHLVVIGPAYSACLICQERPTPSLPSRVSPTALPNPVPGSAAEQASPQAASVPDLSVIDIAVPELAVPELAVPELPAMDQTRRFEGIWTFDRQVSRNAALILLDRIVVYRPELQAKIAAAKVQFLSDASEGLSRLQSVDPDPFAQRLVTYIQASQYKLQKAYRSIAAREQRERLVNSITSAIRRSLDPKEIFKVAVQELGQALKVCRCLIYPCKATDTTTTIQYEALHSSHYSSLLGQTWSLQDHELFQSVIQRQESVAVADTHSPDMAALRQRIDRWGIRSWLLVPILYQGRLMGIVELHNCQAQPHAWSQDELGLVESVATQLGVALMQAESYANLEDLNVQLEALERTRSNLIAITGHELRTPLSTIQVCLESLANEPDMIPELRQVMLDTALTDAERMRKLIQDFLTLSRLESGRVKWHLEAIALEECVNLALSSIHSRQYEHDLPRIRAHVPMELPPVQSDGEWLVEVLSKLLDNACKFTEPQGEVIIEAKPHSNGMMEVTITDTGRGIEPNRLETVFERFYQEEGALRRTAGGTGLGLAICRQILKGLGGQIWAESAGRDQGSRFHLTLPIAPDVVSPPAPPPAPPPRTRRTNRKKLETRS